MSKKGRIEVKDRFILEALRSTGYDVYSAIYELVDNSIDAGSTKIDIMYKDGVLTVQDNGCGMSSEKLEDSMNIGCDRIYSTTEIGYFGVGLKSSCINLINGDSDSFIEICTCDGNEQTNVLWHANDNPFDYDINTEPIVEGIDMKIGTTINIFGCEKFSPQILKKNLGTIFYPILKKEMLKIFVNDDLVNFNDPLYRENKLTKYNFVDAVVADTKISIFCSLIDPTTEKHSWDKNSEEGKWTYSKGGLYIVYGGRYIDYGGTMGLKKTDPWDSRTRIEIILPKELTKEFKLKFNKTNGINLNASDGLHDVVRKTKDMFNWARKQRQLSGETSVSEDEKEELKKHNDELNKSAKEAGFDTKKFNKTPDDGKVGRGKDKEPRKPSQKSAELKKEKFYEIRVENLGATNCFWHLGYDKNIFIITLNESHVFYKDIYRNLNEGGRKDMLYLLASMGYAQYEIKLIQEEGNINDEFFWEDYWSQVSMRLKFLISRS